MPGEGFHAAGTAVRVPRGPAAPWSIEAMKRDGMIRRAFDANGMAAAEVAPPGSYS